MDAVARIEQVLSAAVARVEASGAPPKLAAAIRYAVFPGGARIRPRLCLAVAGACGEDGPAVADAAAAAIELLHCASLVHDDLPCFDDAPLRRGKPSVHRAFGERVAVLTGDALIVLAFQMLAAGGAWSPHRFAELLLIISRGVGMPTGIVAGQAWECEPHVVLADYQRQKTGALFAAATCAGAAAAGADPGAWRTFGERIGEAYQVADDVRDVAADPVQLGKPTGRDAALGRPNAVRELGLAGAVRRLDLLVGEAVDSIPVCRGGDALRAQIRAEVDALLPRDLARRAA
ncbi:MAG: polyprenyl synthetase family protein [Burkholderiales bacterium]|nr:polyprenyl synthetase family protein [Burkholderiales bacterium]